MRNEIYEKISQSRKRYLSELNQKEHQNEIRKEKTSEAVEKAKSTFDPESITVQVGEWVKSKNLKWEIKNRFVNLFQKIPLEGIRERLNKLSNGIQQKLRGTNQKITAHSDKFMEGFVSYSNRIFEDRFESTDIDNPNLNALILQTNSSRQIVWEFADVNSNQYLLPTFSESQLGYFLKKIENAIIRSWKNFRFSIEFDGASLEYIDEVRIIPLSEEGKHIDFVQTCKTKDTNLFVQIEKGYAKQDNSVFNELECEKTRFFERMKQFFNEQIFMFLFKRKEKTSFPKKNKLSDSRLKLPLRYNTKKALQHGHRALKL